ncbi:hypothetical protein JTB14_009408 [Gonioctena quinquepunctata]|nr:hypothetical protein JTB14_009408 [Gonioctena quinquepunctata]
MKHLGIPFEINRECKQRIVTKLFASVTDTWARNANRAETTPFTLEGMEKKMCDPHTKDKSHQHGKRLIICLLDASGNPNEILIREILVEEKGDYLQHNSVSAKNPQQHEPL